MTHNLCKRMSPLKVNLSLSFSASFLSLVIFLLSSSPALTNPKSRNAAHVPTKTLEMVRITDWVFFNTGLKPMGRWSDLDVITASVKVAMVTGGCREKDGRYVVSVEAVDAIAERYFGRRVVDHAVNFGSHGNITYINGAYVTTWDMDDSQHSYFVSSRLVDLTTCTVLQYGVSVEDNKGFPSALFTLTRATAHSPWRISDYKNLLK